MDLKKFQPVDKLVAEGLHVAVTPFPARTAFALQTKLVKLIGKPLISLLKVAAKPVLRGETTEFSFASLDIDALSDDLFSGIDTDALFNIAIELCQSTEINRQRFTMDVFNEIFTGRLSDFYRVLFFILQVNFKDFLGQPRTTER